MISLTAEQKNLEGMYCSSTEQYIVPMYQRPYSWGFDQCSELFRDLTEAYVNRESYFLGNVILARSKDYDMNGQSYIIDGQQRLITVWTLIKVLSLIFSDVNTLRTALSIIPWEGNSNEPKIKSLIFENKDNEAIVEVFCYDLEMLKECYEKLTTNDTSLKEEKCKSQIEASLLFFYEQLSNYRLFQDDHDEMKSFAQFLMKRVSMLPIVQTANNKEEANNKALTIFETINNRGLDLEDADIFKARLYESAYKGQQKNEFINLWTDFKSECNSLGLSIDDIFRYYSHIIRGKEGITSSEKRLRDFFTNESYSPLTYCTYDQILTNLNKILTILKYLRKESGANTTIGPWLQVINEYTNRYPMCAIVVYLYNHEVETDTDRSLFVDFLQSLIRYCLYTGSTASVKFEIYSIIKSVSNQNYINSYCRDDISSDAFSRLGRLKNAFALLAYYLDTNAPIPSKYSIDKIVNLRDEDYLRDDWKSSNLNDVCNSIGNLVVLDIPKRYNSLKDKYNQYKTSSSKYVQSVFLSEYFSYSDWQMRDVYMKNLLVTFFSIKNEKQ